MHISTNKAFLKRANLGSLVGGTKCGTLKTKSMYQKFCNLLLCNAMIKPLPGCNAYAFPFCQSKQCAKYAQEFNPRGQKTSAHFRERRIDPFSLPQLASVFRFPRYSILRFRRLVIPDWPFFDYALLAFAVYIELEFFSIASKWEPWLQDKKLSELWDADSNIFSTTNLNLGPSSLF